MSIDIAGIFNQSLKDKHVSVHLYGEIDKTVPTYSGMFVKSEIREDAAGDSFLVFYLNTGASELERAEFYFSNKVTLDVC